MPAESFTFEVSRTSDADAATLFALVSDGARWSEWAKPLIASSSLVKPGADAPNGVGSIRKLGAGPVGVKEETTAYEQDRLHAYKLLTPGPVSNYRAEVRLEPRAGGGTNLTWHGTFDEKIPGTGKFARRGLAKFIGAVADKAIKAAERR
ncbi:SRPBCC family protein [Haloechinothrix salitolerans]|uniref:SRPBCC family protein n=1 Tax=Haloechinothrix salitolerans TaxID=926830 RepID=A0ABW2BSS8_9PSEU